MHSLCSQVAPKWASDLGWLYLKISAVLYKRKSFDSEKNLKGIKLQKF